MICRVSYLHEMFKVSTLEEGVSEVKKKGCREEEGKVLGSMAGPKALKPSGY